MTQAIPKFLLCCLMAGSVAGFAQASAISVHRYTGSERGYNANAWWLESDQGIVLVDALFLKPDAELLATLLASRQKPLAAIFLTHPHVDHFGGLGTLRKRFPGVPIYATLQTASAVKTTHEKAFADGWIQAYGSDYDAEVVIPDHIVETGQELRLAGMRFTVRSLGPMEAADNTVFFNHDLGALFVGDALVQGGIYYLGEGFSAQTIVALEALATAYPKGTLVFAGHSDPGLLHLVVEENLEQVRAMRRLVEEAASQPGALTPRGVFRDVVRERLIGAMSELLRSKLAYGLAVEMVARMNLAGLERELLATPLALSQPSTGGRTNG